MPMYSLQEAHCWVLQSQTNVYGMTRVGMHNGLQKLLVTPVQGNVVSMEFNKKPLSKVVHFAYIPADAEVASIDAFNKLNGSGLVVGIAFIKSVAETEVKSTASHYLNIYSEWGTGEDFNLEVIAQGCQILELGFMPFQLYHTEVLHDGSLEMMFLLSGDDKKVHLYRGTDTDAHIFREVQIEDLFPELSDIPSNVMCMKCRSYEYHKKRLTSYGCQNGHVAVAVVDVQQRVMLQKWTNNHNSPITSLELFSLYSHVSLPGFLLQGTSTPVNDCVESNKSQEFHLLVTSAIELTVVYRNVLGKGLREMLAMPESNKYDMPLCCKTVDLDFDGQVEVLIGTYGQELLAYKFYPKKTQSESSSSECDPKEKQVTVEYRSTDQLTNGEFKLMWRRSMVEPILGLDAVDIIGDGVLEIVVLTLKGIHVLQYDMHEVADLTMQCMKKLVEQRESNPT